MDIIGLIQDRFLTERLFAVQSVFAILYVSYFTNTYGTILIVKLTFSVDSISYTNVCNKDDLKMNTLILFTFEIKLRITSSSN